MTCNKVGNSIYRKDSMNATKFKIFHGERYSRDVNKNCHALPTQQQMVSSMLGPPLPTYTKKKIYMKSSSAGTYGHSEYESERNPGVFYFIESHFTDQENNKLLHAKPINPSSLNLVLDASLHHMKLVLI